MRWVRTLMMQLTVVAVLAGLGNTVTLADDLKGQAAGPKKPLAKNVILMISDGCGYNHVDAASLFEHGKTGVQVYESFPFRAGMSTYSYSKGTLGRLTLGEYDPSKAWSDPQYVTRGYTDSAAASTTMSTGHKTYGGAIGMDTNREPLLHAWEKAERAGKMTGVVSSVQWSHATPAAFVAHNESRSNYAAIACEMLSENPTDVIMGCGHPWFDANGQSKTKPNKFDFVGGQETWNALADGRTGGDADGDGKADRWTLVQTREEFQSLMTGPTPQRVCGVAQVSKTLQQGRAGDAEAVPFQVPLIETVPTLAEMTRAAINVLDDDPDGFCLMIEAGAVDWAGHDNQTGRTIEEQIDFNRAVEAVVQWVDQNSSWDDTLLIVTADHETGYLTAPVPTGQPSPDASVRLTNNGKGVSPGLKWNSGSHTNCLVPVYAKGTAARLLTKLADQQDPKRGAYVDNAEIGKVLHAVISGAE
ncbi:MAG: alkaline phosphatase [Planctomycetes bacterium]|nr:alkaline phosphatase [Planctomycetota bacterium]MBL7041682.1 alkaline phosphatase [Pirellulaceae bacterium]